MGKAVCHIKCKTGRKRFVEVMQMDDQKGNLFKTSKRMVKTNLEDGVLTVSDEDMKTASK